MIKVINPDTIKVNFNNMMENLKHNESTIFLKGQTLILKYDSNYYTLERQLQGSYLDRLLQKDVYVKMNQITLPKYKGELEEINLHCFIENVLY